MQFIKEIPINESIFLKKSIVVPEQILQAVEHVKKLGLKKEVEISFDAPYKRFRALLKKSVPGRVRVLARAMDKDGKTWRVMLAPLKRSKRSKPEKIA